MKQKQGNLKLRSDTKIDRERRIATTREEQEEAVFQASGISFPENYYFIVKRKRRHKELHVPRNVVKECNFQIGENIQIRDERNRNWPAKIHKWKDGSIYLSNGWKSFCKWNDVKFDDWCICEVIPESEENEMYLKVRIVRAALTAKKSS